MTKSADLEPLFEEFPPVSTEEWEDQIRRDLKGADYAEVLLWHTRDGMTIRPYYRSDDLDQIAHLSEDAEREDLEAGTAPLPPSQAWVLQQNLVVDEDGDVSEELLRALEGGVESIGFEFLSEHPELGVLFDQIPLDRVAVHLDAGLRSPDLFRKLRRELEIRSVDPDYVHGTLGYDPLGQFAHSGALSFSMLDDAAELIREAHFDGVRLLCAGADAYHDAGATSVQETALVTAAISEYLARLIERGVGAREVLRRLYISVPVSTTFFLEIAKLRALRLLIPQVVHAYLPDEEAYQLPIHVETSARTMTLYGPHENLLRTTTEAASAVIGGCDVLVVRPFDDVSGRGSAFSHRLARNIQHLLRHEANLDKVRDAAGGSYYVETLTDAVARRSWMLFKEIEAKGGLIRALEGGFVQEQIRKSRGELEAEVAEQRRVLVGTNKYPDADERMSEFDRFWKHARSQVPSGSGSESADVEAEPLEAFREAEAFEAIRLATEEFERTPSIVVLPIGSPEARTARANFAVNFLACGGFKAEVRHGYDTPQTAFAEAQASPDLLILAADEEHYSHEVLSKAKDIYSQSYIGIVASPDTLLDVDFSIHRRADAVKTLREIQERLRSLPEHQDLSQA